LSKNKKQFWKEAIQIPLSEYLATADPDLRITVLLKGFREVLTVETQVGCYRDISHPSRE
jgi:hypothetical protein